MTLADPPYGLLSDMVGQAALKIFQ